MADEIKVIGDSVKDNQVLTPEVIQDQPIINNVVATDVVNPLINTTGGSGKIIDKFGLISSGSFNFGSIYLDAPADFTNTSFADVPNTSQTFKLLRLTRVLFIVTIVGGTDAGTATIRLSITGIASGDTVPVISFNTTNNIRTIHRIFQVPKSDLVTFKLQAQIVAPATKLQFGGGYITT